MATLFETAMNGFNAADAMIRSQRGYQAARKQYGDGKASDPGLFSALEGMELAQKADVRADRYADIAERQDSRAAQSFNTEQSSVKDARQKDAILNMVNGLREARDQGEDLGVAFDALADTLPGLGVSQEDLPAMKEELLKNPAILDQYYEALTGNTKMSAAERKAAKAEQDALIQAEKGRRDVSRTINKMREQYAILDENNAIVNPGESIWSNIGARTRTSMVGRAVEGALGTQSESARRTIEGLRPSLINAMKGAEEMGARMFDSNKDMELWLSTVTDPTQDIDTVYRLLDEFEEKYGAAMEGSEISPIRPPVDRSEAGDYRRSDGSGLGDIPQGWVSPEGDKFVGTDPSNPTHWQDKNGNLYGEQ